VLPNAQSGRATGVRRRRLSRVKEIARRSSRRRCLSASSVKDFDNGDRQVSRQIRPRLEQYRSSRAASKIMKLLWDCGRDRGSAGGTNSTRSTMRASRGHPIQALFNARSTGTYDKMIALADQCMADYDEKGWGATPGSTRTMSPIRACPRRCGRPSNATTCCSYWPVRFISALARVARAHTILMRSVSPRSRASSLGEKSLPVQEQVAGLACSTVSRMTSTALSRVHPEGPGATDTEQIRTRAVQHSRAPNQLDRRSSPSGCRTRCSG